MGELHYFDKIVKLVKFKVAYKKPLTYKQVFSISDARKRTFYIHTSDVATELVTIVDGKREVVNRVCQGDFVITGSQGEKYAIKPDKFVSLYNIIDGKVVPRRIPKTVAEVTNDIWNIVVPKHIKTITFIAPWGEQMILEKGDFIVKDKGGGYYRNAGKIFKHDYDYSK